tara:strand:- start:42 stop:557 length:516 start_codon:yes stop_codon:yes gene_type:complete
MAMQPIFLTGVCDWAQVTQPNTTFDVHAWEIDIRTDEEMETLLTSIGVVIRNKPENKRQNGDESGNFVKCKRKCVASNGPRKAPSIVDSQNTPWDTKSIGNGSKVIVKAIPYEWNFGGKAGVGLDLDRVQVIDLVPYGDEGFSVVEGGYINPEATQAFQETVTDSDIPFGN